MKAAALFLWTLCLILIALSLARFVWIATAAERILVLALLVVAGIWALWKKK